MGSPDPETELRAHVHPHVARIFKPPVMSTTSAYKRVHASSTFRTPTKPRPLMLIDPHTLPRVGSITRSHSYSTPSHSKWLPAKRWGRSAHLHGVCASGGSKRSRDRENDHMREGSWGDVFGVAPSVSSSYVKAKGRVHDDLRRPLTSLEVVRRLEEGADADVWIDTDVDGDVPVVSERAIALNSLERDVFG